MHTISFENNYSSGIWIHRQQFIFLFEKIRRKFKFDIKKDKEKIKKSQTWLLLIFLFRGGVIPNGLPEV